MQSLYQAVIRRWLVGTSRYCCCTPRISMRLHVHLSTTLHAGPVTGGKCGDRAFVGNVLRTMYQQLAVDDYNGGKGSCRGTAFVSGAFIFEDEADGSMCERLLDAGAYSRASSHKVRRIFRAEPLARCKLCAASSVEATENVPLFPLAATTAACAPTYCNPRS